MLRVTRKQDGDSIPDQHLAKIVERKVLDKLDAKSGAIVPGLVDCNLELF